MDLMETIYHRRSVRNFAIKPIEKTTIETLLEAAVQAPSAMNSQPWAFAVIQDQQWLKKCSDQAKSFLLSHLEHFPPLRKYEAALGNPSFQIFYNAPALVVIYAKPESPHTVEDSSLAAQNLMLAAHSLGLGTCWIGFATPLLNLPEWKQELGAPPEYAAIAPIIIGYPQTVLPQLEKKSPDIIIWK